jgi:peroxiredoxin
MMLEYAYPTSDHVGTGAPVGHRVADLRATDLDGNTVDLAALVAKQPILLVFYRGGWCPYCNTQIRDLTTAFADFQARGVLPVAVSVDRPEAVERSYTIPFPVLSDPDATWIEAFGVVNHVTGAQLAAIESFGIDLERYAGRPHHNIAIPSLFLIDSTGTVRWAHAVADFKVRPSAAQIHTAIDRAGVGR